MIDFADSKIIIIAIYLILVFAIGLLSLIAIAVLNKNAEKPSTAKMVGITYALLFTLLFIFSLRAITKL
ncbi:MAG: hypothetical protein JNK33_02325 [Candidatus Doudnabacteria bacterium]|nr:hypothetical protein [Candidatus Doudnabacteria bacterium]